MQCFNRNIPILPLVFTVLLAAPAIARQAPANQEDRRETRVQVRVAHAENGDLPLAGARVDFNGLETQITDAAGMAQFTFRPAAGQDRLPIRVSVPASGKPLSSHFTASLDLVELVDERIPAGSVVQNGRTIERSRKLRTVQHFVYLKPLGDYISPLVGSTGGFFVLGDGNVTVQVPAGEFTNEEPRRIVVTNCPPHAMSEADPEWLLRAVSQFNLSVVDENWNLVPVTFASPLTVTIRDPLFMKDEDDDGFFEFFCGYDLSRDPRWAEELQLGRITATGIAAIGPNPQYDFASGHVSYSLGQSGAWFCRTLAGLQLPPPAPGPVRQKTCDGEIKIETSEEWREKAGTTVSCGGAAGTAHYGWTSGTEITNSLSGEGGTGTLLNVLAKLKVHFGSDKKTYHVSSGGGEVGTGNYGPCYSGYLALMVQFKIAKEVCYPKDGGEPFEIGRIEVEQTSVTEARDENRNDAECPGCGGNDD